MSTAGASFKTGKGPLAGKRTQTPVLQARSLQSGASTASCIRIQLKNVQLLCQISLPQKGKKQNKNKEYQCQKR